MKKRLTAIIALALFSVLCSCGVSKTDYEHALSQRESLQTENEELNNQLRAWEASYNALDAKYSELETKYIELQHNASDWLKLTEDEKAAKLAQAEADRIAAEEAEKKAKEERDAAEAAAAEEARKKAEAEEAKKEEEEKRGYETGITYDNLARNPDDYQGKKVKFTGQVLQVFELTDEIQVRLATKDSGWGTYYEDVVYLYFRSALISSRILEDDVITVYGTAQGLHSYTTVMGATVTLPLIQVDKIEMP